MGYSCYNIYVITHSFSLSANKLQLTILKHLKLQNFTVCNYVITTKTLNCIR